MTDDLTCPDCGGPIYLHSDGDILCERDSLPGNSGNDIDPRCPNCGNSDLSLRSPVPPGPEICCDSCGRGWTWEGIAFATEGDKPVTDTRPG